MTDRDILKLYREMELMLIDSMKRNLGLHLAEEKQTKLDYPQWQAVKIRELRKYQEENSKIISTKLKGLPDEIAKHLREELTQGHASEIAKYRSVIGEKRYKSAIANAESFFKIDARKVDALIKEVNGSLYKANTAALRMINDTYRDVIFKYGFFSANGVLTEQQAVDKAVEDFLNRGLNCIEYKDGRRVNIADYAAMAVRTANQRAHLMGEGEFRKAIGNPLVIVSRHGTACELCKPFENKVLIDDVYSGGTQADGDYMLLSETVELGFLHPNCRHGLGTYYPEIDEIDRQYADYKEENVTDYGVYNKAHIENMIHKYRRLALGSVSPENVEKYKTKLQEWEGKLGGNVDNNSESGIINKSDIDLKNDNQYIREWYVEHVSDISNRIDKTQTFEEQVKQAFELRNEYKKEARKMMTDRETVERLEKLKPAPRFEQLVQDKMLRKNMTRKEALSDILNTASKTNKDINKEFNL